MVHAFDIDILAEFFKNRSRRISQLLTCSLTQAAPHLLSATGIFLGHLDATCAIFFLGATFPPISDMPLLIKFCSDDQRAYATFLFLAAQETGDPSPGRPF